jgi:hypothetical protein
MTPLRNASDHIHLPRAEFEALLEVAAEKGARKALADVGLEGETAAEDVRDLRSLLEAIKIVRHTALQTMVHVIVTATLILVVIGATIKLKLFGSGS